MLIPRNPDPFFPFPWEALVAAIFGVILVVVIACAGCGDNLSQRFPCRPDGFTSSPCPGDVGRATCSLYDYRSEQWGGEVDCVTGAGDVCVEVCR